MRILWSAVLLLWGLWSFLDGTWGPVKNRATRRACLRAAPLPRRVYSCVLEQLVAVPGNKLPDFSALLMAPILHAVGLFTFFGVIWPRYKDRVQGSETTPA